MVKSSRILITGGYGFLASYIARALAEESSNQVVLFDKNSSSGTSGHDLGLADYQNVHTINGSIIDQSDMRKLDDGFDYIVHTAGFLGIQNVAANQLDNMDINVIGTKYCLDVAARQKHLKMYVQFSTSEIYGLDSMQSSEEDDSIIKTIGQRWTYATSKLAGEYYVKAYAQKYGLRTAIVRPFNIYGTHRYGNNAMTALIRLALRNEPLMISGDGQQVRAWCSVKDFRDALISLLGAEDITSGEAFNIGDDRYAITMEELAKLIVKTIGSKSTVNIQGVAIEDVLSRKPNINKAKQRLSYSPKINLEQGIKEVSDWLKASGA